MDARLSVEGSGPGVLPLVVAAACYGVGAVPVGRWFADVPPITVVAGVLAVAGTTRPAPAGRRV